MGRICVLNLNSGLNGTVEFITIDDFNSSSSFIQITDDNYVSFLAGWQSENKPSVIIFDQPPFAPLLYKVSSIYVYAHTNVQLVAVYFFKKTFLVA